MKLDLIDFDIDGDPDIGYGSSKKVKIKQKGTDSNGDPILEVKKKKASGGNETIEVRAQAAGPPGFSPPAELAFAYFESSRWVRINGKWYYIP